MRIAAILILHVLVTSLSRVVSTRGCSRDCEGHHQVLGCTWLSQRSLLLLQVCLESLNRKFIVVDLKLTGIRCSCLYLEVTSQLLASDTLVFGGERCSSSRIQRCRDASHSYPAMPMYVGLNSSAGRPPMPAVTNTSSTSRSPGKLVHVLGAVFDLNDADWHSSMERHHYRLMSVLSGLRSVKTRLKYTREAMVKISKAMRFGLKFASRLKTGNTTLALNGDWKQHVLQTNPWTPPTPEVSDRMVKIIIFSTVVGVAVLCICLALLCKLECERRKMFKNETKGDLYVDSGVRKHMFNLEKFLDKLIMYKRQKSDASLSQSYESFPPPQLFIEQPDMDSTGKIVLSEKGQAVAMSAFTKLVEQQPRISESQSSYATSAHSRTSMRFEPLGVSSRETNGSDTALSDVTEMDSFHDSNIGPQSVPTVTRTRSPNQ